MAWRMQGSGSAKDLEDMAQVVIASRLSDGRVVFLKETVGPDSAEWVLALEGADRADGDERATALLRLAETDAAENQTIIDPYLIDVEESGGQLRPTRYREVLRCLGPSVRLDLGKQAESQEA